MNLVDLTKKLVKETRYMFSKENVYQLKPIPIETHAEREFRKRQP